MVFDYLDAGADDEISLRRGKDAYTELEMHYKILAGIKPPLDLSTKIFGMDVKLPFFGCPTAGNRMFHWEGEAAAARAACYHIGGLRPPDGVRGVDDAFLHCHNSSHVAPSVLRRRR